ncbi:hypothetical protein MMC2321_02262 [Chitinophaga sp. MM2321]
MYYNGNNKYIASNPAIQSSIFQNKKGELK